MTETYRGGTALVLTPHVALVGGGALGAEISHGADSNVYLVHDGHEGVLVDAGCGLGARDILSAVEDAAGADLIIREILITHAHADHAAGAAGLARRTGAVVRSSEAVAGVLDVSDPELSGLDGAKRDGLYPAEVAFEPISPRLIGEGDEVRVGSLTITALVTEGHADGHLCFLLEDDEGGSAVFTGDLVFAGGRVAILDTPDTRVDRLTASLERVVSLAPQALFPGHGIPVMRRALDHLFPALEALRAGRRPLSLVG